MVLSARLLTASGVVALGVAIASCVIATPCAADDAPVFVISGARVETISDGVIDPGVVLVRGGKIEAVGAPGDIEVPPEAEIVDAAGHVLLPSFVLPICRFGTSGAPGGNANAVEPARNAHSDLDPWSRDLLWVAANGFATLGVVPGEGIVAGRGVAIDPRGDSIESIVRRENVLLRVDVAAGPRFLATLKTALGNTRKALEAHAKYELDHAQWELDKAAAEKDKKPVPKEPAKPKALEDDDPYPKVLQGETTLLAITGSSSDVLALAEALDDQLARGEKTRLYTWVSGDFHRAPEVLLDLGTTVVVRAGTERWTGTRDLYCPARFLHELGLPIVLLPGPGTRDALRDYPRLLAETVRAGLPRDVALRAATLGGAELLGLGKDTGAISKGRRADLQLFDGDPLLATTRRTRVWIDGEVVEETP